MQFTTGTDGSTIIGMGQFRDVGGTTAAQMQMISGAAGGPYVTHWAYMLLYDPTTLTPPDPRPSLAITSTQWAWTLGTRWRFQSDDLFGPGGGEVFPSTAIAMATSGGSGAGPVGSPNASFTQLGSITPEGNVLFNLLDASGTLISLAGLVTCIRGCGCRLPAGRQATPGSCRGRHGPARVRPRRSAGLGPARVVAARGARRDGAGSSGSGPGTVPQEVLEAPQVARHVPVHEGDADARVDGKTAVLPGEHVGGGLGVEESVAEEPAHESRADAVGECQEIGRRDGPGR